MSTMQGISMQASTGKVWKGTAVGGILITAISAYEPVKDVYMKIYNPDYAGIVSVPFAEHQFKLADKNADCFLNMKRAKVQVTPDLAISYGACPNNNVHIAVYPKGKPAYQRWLEPNREQDLARVSMGGSFFSTAFAGVPEALPKSAGSERNFTPVQIELKTMCQEWLTEDKTKIARITDEGGQCFFERTNVLSGVVEVREPAQCNTPCLEEAQKYVNIK
ncbi:MAG TPA: hypothetical protein VKA94_00905 [Hyphomicrobiales bacterium]|nr:hypothetical protein [Hyphomicrobiales bacterium]